MQGRSLRRRRDTFGAHVVHASFVTFRSRLDLACGHRWHDVREVRAKQKASRTGWIGTSTGQFDPDRVSDARGCARR